MLNVKRMDKIGTVCIGECCGKPLVLLSVLHRRCNLIPDKESKAAGEISLPHLNIKIRVRVATNRIFSVT